MDVGCIQLGSNRKHPTTRALNKTINYMYVCTYYCYATHRTPDSCCIEAMVFILFLVAMGMTNGLVLACHDNLAMTNGSGSRVLICLGSCLANFLHKIHA